jgi:SAM-dependent methyltransferase
LEQWRRQREELKHVELLHRAAHELSDLADGSFDTVLLNSVIQYFPNVEYLLGVIRDAVRLLVPGGQLFIGDVRNLRLLESFHGAVQLCRADASVSVRELRRRVVRAMSQETELVVDPELFEVLVGEVPGICAAHVRMKRGEAQNELTCYRYDVVLEKGVSAPCLAKPVHWSRLANDPSANTLGQQLILRLRSHLAERLSERQVPSAWTILNQLPLARDGGVNRSLL